jgi:hypothetical protein
MTEPTRGGGFEITNTYWDVRVPWIEGFEHLAKLGGDSGTQPLS